MKFRILSNGIRYKIQCVSGFGLNKSPDKFFNTYADAVDFIYTQYGESAEIERPGFKPVGGATTSELLRKIECLDFARQIIALEKMEEIQEVLKLVEGLTIEVCKLRRSNKTVKSVLIRMLKKEQKPEGYRLGCIGCKKLNDVMQCTNTGSDCVRGSGYTTK